MTSSHKDPTTQQHSITTSHPHRFIYSLNTSDFESVICIEDIAHSLAFQCRFVGHCNFFWSVAAHSILLHDYIIQFYPDATDLLLGSLLHDAHEAYTHDINTPLRRYLKQFTTAYEDLCKAIQDAIEQQFNVTLSEQECDILKACDKEIQLREGMTVLKDKGKGLQLPKSTKAANIINASIKIEEIHPKGVENLFLEKVNLYI